MRCPKEKNVQSSSLEILMNSCGRRFGYSRKSIKLISLSERPLYRKWRIFIFAAISLALKTLFFAGQLYTKTMLRFSLNVKIQGKKAYEKTRNNIRLFVFKSDLIIHFPPTKYLVSRDHLMAIWNNDISGSEL